ncbi:MAG: hypothetical protein Kow0056_01020 [Coriobacteriia bacterium]
MRWDSASFAAGVSWEYVFLALFVLWIWMLIDAIQRQEYEFPNSSGNTKTIWLIAMLASWVLSLAPIVGLVYYFMVYKKVPRGSVQPPTYGGPPAGPGAPPPPAAGAGTPPPPAAPGPEAPAGGGAAPPPSTPAPGDDTPPPPPPAG